MPNDDPQQSRLRRGRSDSGMTAEASVQGPMPLARFPFGRVDGRRDDQAGGVRAVRNEPQVAG
jgi:hypothetical protein